MGDGGAGASSEKSELFDPVLSRKRARGSRTSTAQRADDRAPHALGVGAEVEEDAGRETVILEREAEEDVLRADVVVAEGERLAKRELEHLLRARREGDLPRRHLLAGADDTGDLSSNVIDGQVKALERAGRDAVSLS
jgi:hypothetical protein